MNEKAKRNRNEIEVVEAQERAAVVPYKNREMFLQAVEEALANSPLAVGTKFSSDDLANAESVVLWDFEWIDYIKDRGTRDEEEVHYALWAVEVDGERGYTNGGFALNRIAERIDQRNLKVALTEFGIPVECYKERAKDPKKSDYLVVNIIET